MNPISTTAYYCCGVRMEDAEGKPSLCNDRFAKCPNPLRRMAIAFAADSLAGKLAAVANDKPVVVIMEGVFMYLEPTQIDNTLRDISSRFPRHVLLCDLMNRAFFEKVGQSVHSKLSAVGAVFTERPDDPAEIFRRNGYVQTANVPMFRRAMELGVLWDRARIPAVVARLMLGVLLKELNGFAVRRFVYG